MYGPAEATIDATWLRVDDDVHLGAPVDGTSLTLVDRRWRPVGPGQLGEIALSGSSLALGYLGSPKETARRFVPGPDGSRLYLTGDLARWEGRQVLRYHGRRDRQIKVHGQRLELEEVEGVLRNLPDVRDAVVAKEPGGPLHAVVVSQQPVAKLAEAMRTQLPIWAVPSRWSVVAELPKNASGKVDFAALPPAPSNAPEPPSHVETDAARALRAIWTELLGREPGPQEHFFDAGGTSLLLVRLQARIRHELGCMVTVGALFEATTLRTQVALLERLAPSAGPAAMQPARREALHRLQAHRKKP
jgi:hypothetical protein